MAKSMTAYGRSSIHADGALWTLELHSVNKKNLEIFLHLPKELLFLDAPLRKKVSQKVSRGHLVMRLSKQTPKAEDALPPHFLSSLEKLKTRWIQVSDHLGLDPQEITLEFLLKRYLEEENGSEKIHEEWVENVLGPLCETALQDFEGMRAKEGLELSQDILTRVVQLENVLSTLESLCSDLPQKYKEKLLERLKAFEDVEETYLDRSAKELAFYAEKMDITEEIVRLRSHCKQVVEMLQKPDVSIGKNLEFLLQEAFREVNTIGSKVMDIEATKLCLKLKSEFEKIKEQIQNIE